MNKEKSKQINIRATEREIETIKRNAARCGMSVTQFLILRGLGFIPKPMPPAAYYHFIERIDSLRDYSISSELDNQISSLVNDIRNVMVDMRKEDLKQWLSQVSGR